MNLRSNQEESEIKNLSKYASKSRLSKGRKIQEEKCPVRTEFQRDRDRIIYSKAFRRLKHKTQVFIKPEDDHYRTRLTHTLEVAQISRTIARALLLNEDLTEAISLGHDLGHSPFGHAGEKALDEIYNHYVPEENFRHYEQSLRVVDFIEKKNGLNLTYEVRMGILNHSKGRSCLNFDDNCNEESTLEGEIVRISDRVAYINHDIDDAMRAGIIKFEDIPKDCSDILGNTLTKRINTMVMDIINNSIDQPRIIMSETINNAVEKLKEFMFENVYLNSPAKTEEIKAEELLKTLYKYYMDHPEFLPEFLVAKGFDLDDTKQRARAVLDYVSGMTDGYALYSYQNIFIPKGWI